MARLDLEQALLAQDSLIRELFNLGIGQTIQEEAKTKLPRLATVTTVDNGYLPIDIMEYAAQAHKELLYPGWRLHTYPRELAEDVFDNILRIQASRPINFQTPDPHSIKFDLHLVEIRYTPEHYLAVNGDTETFDGALEPIPSNIPPSSFKSIYQKISRANRAIRYAFENPKLQHPNYVVGSL